MSITIRAAEPGDTATVLRFVRELAAYEREPDAVAATEEQLHVALFGDRPVIEALIAERSGEPVGFVKVIADATYNEIIGAHLIGPDVTELLPVLTIAQKWDLTADEAARNIFAHPTLSEAVKEAVEGIAGHMIHM